MGIPDPLPASCKTCMQVKKQQLELDMETWTGWISLIVWITTNWKILQGMGIPDHLTCLLRNLYGDQEATETDVEQQTGSKLGNEYIKAEYCHPTYLTSMQSTL